MHHRLLCVLGASLAMASVATVPALATDEPPAAALQPAPSTQDLQQVLQKCADTTRPSSGLGSTSTSSAARSHVLRGSARDVGCGVAMVTVSVARRVGTRCEYLTANGRLSRPTSCAGGHWLVAAGGAQWRLTLPKRLPRGTYLVRSRAVDFAGNMEPARTIGHVRRLKLS